ncbi:MAG: phage terminase large subunit family protein [Pirellulales bacterium]
MAKYLRTYFRHKFRDDFSDDLLTAVKLLQRTILKGGNFALAMPRGGGKSTIAEGGDLWATSYGHRGFVVTIGASKQLAMQSLENIQAELLTNELLSVDFPEMVHPIRALENIANKSAGQLYKGESTYIKWKRDRVVFVRIPGAPCSGAIIRAAGLTGGLRGLNEKGRRPDLAIVDDWQTDSSARSASQTRSRLKLINGAVMGLAGPGKTIAVYAPMTVIEQGDGADQLLNPQLYPEWNGRRFGMLKSFPTNMELWAKYNELRRASFRNGGDGREARAFYKQHRREMDAGAAVSWEARKHETDVSALEHAMILYFKDPKAFWAEYQNDPKPDDAAETGELKADEIARRVNNLRRYVVPLNATRLTCYIDVQHHLLYYACVAWANDFSGDLVDYGTFPDQGRGYFAYRDARHTLQKVYPKLATEAAVFEGLTVLVDILAARRFPREGDAGEMRLELIGVDWSDGQLQETIGKVCRTSLNAVLLLPCEGKGIGPADRPMHLWPLKPGEQPGDNWLLGRSLRQGNIRRAVIDTNFWKSQTAGALTRPAQNPGAMRLFGTRDQDHEMIAAHCLAETRTRLTNDKSGRTVEIWKAKPNKPDNHLWDCINGARVMASIRGCKIAVDTTTPPPAVASQPVIPRTTPQRDPRVRPMF